MAQRAVRSVRRALARERRFRAGNAGSRHIENGFAFELSFRGNELRLRGPEVSNVCTVLRRSRELLEYLLLCRGPLCRVGGIERPNQRRVERRCPKPGKCSNRVTAWTGSDRFEP